MKVKTKLIMSGVKLSWIIHRTKKIGKKYLKYEDEEKYPAQWRNDWSLKKTKKIAKKLMIELTVKGFDNLPKGGAILVPNHSSSIDPGIILMSLENPSKVSTDLNKLSVFIAKDDIRDNKKIKGFASLLNTFYIDRKSPRKALKEIDKFGDFVKKEKKYGIIFAEGTRSKDGKIQEFKGGAFRVAKKNLLPIVPVTINNAIGISNLSRTKPIKVEVIFGKPIKPMSLMTMDTKTIAAKVEKLVKKNWKAPVDKADRAYEEKVA